MSWSLFSAKSKDRRGVGVGVEWKASLNALFNVYVNLHHRRFKFHEHMTAVLPSKSVSLCCQSITTGCINGRYCPTFN